MGQRRGEFNQMPPAGWSAGKHKDMRAPVFRIRCLSQTQQAGATAVVENLDETLFAILMLGDDRSVTATFIAGEKAQLPDR